MPTTPPTHPLALSTVLVQQPSSSPPPSAGSPPPVALRLKTTFRLLVPSLPPPDVRALKPAALAQTAVVWPSRADGGVMRVGVGMRVRGEAVEGRLGWVGERVREAFTTNEAALGLAGVSPLADAHFDLQTTSLPSAADGSAGARPTAFLEALDLHLSWGAKPPKPRARRPTPSETAAAAGDVSAADAAQAGTEDVPMADGADETDEMRARDELAQLVAEQAQITHNLVALATAGRIPSSGGDPMRRTLDACLLRLIKGHLVKLFPRVFNGRYVKLAASDLPELPSIARSMRTIVQSMTDKGRKREAKALYQTLSDDLEQLERRGRQSIKDFLRPPAVDPNAMDLSAFDPSSSSSDDDDDNGAQEREDGTAADFERVLVGGLARMWETGLVPKRPPTMHAPPTPEPTSPLSVPSSPPVHSALEPLADLDSFHDDIALSDRFAALEWESAASPSAADEQDVSVSSWMDDVWADPDVEAMAAED